MAGRGRIAALVAAMVVLGTVLGCQLSVGDPPAPQKPMKLTAAELNCLEAALPTVQRYFSGNVNVEQVDAAWSCAVGALDSFLVNTRGTNEAYYTGFELRTFLQEYFLGDLRVSDGLLAQFMGLKQLVVGGQKDRVTRQELQRVREILQLLKRESVRLLPHIRYIANAVEPSVARQHPAEVERAITEFNGSLAVLSKLLSQSETPYALSDLERFLREFQELYSRPNNEWTGPSWIIERVPTIAALKSFFLRPQGEIVQPAEWQELITTVGRLYGTYLRYRYYLSDRDLLSGESLEQTSRLLQEVFSLLDNAVAAKKNGVINYAIVNGVIDELIRIKVVDLPLAPATVKGLVRIAGDKVLNAPIDPPQFSRRGHGGFTASTVASLRSMVFGWLEMQKLWRDTTAIALQRDPTLAGKPIPLTLIREIWPTLSASNKVSYEDLSAILLRKDVPLTFTGNDTVVFEREAKAHFMNQKSFNAFNWKVHAVRAAVQGYSADPVAFRYKGLSKSEFLAFFADIKQAAVELGYVAPNDNELAESLFTELNLFMLSSDGNDRLSFSEGVDFVAYAVSSSFVWHKVFDDLKANCRSLDNDVFGLPKFEANCFRSRIRTNFAALFDRLPRWVRMAGELSRSDWNDFLHELESAARKTGFSPASVESTDLSRTGMVTHYIESVFTRFDLDKSGVLSREEADRAFPLLRGVLAEVSGFTSDDDLFPLFTYLLHYGEAPERSITGGLKWLWWKGSSGNWTVSADRRTLLLILANLNEARKKAAAPH